VALIDDGSGDIVAAIAQEGWASDAIGKSGRLSALSRYNASIDAIHYLKRWLEICVNGNGI
jgi:hypothetical protein